MLDEKEAGPDPEVYSESQFKTMKYRPEFPDRFDSREQARAFCQHFFGWYNTEHRHSGIGLLTPAAMHDGRGAAITEHRAVVLAAAFAISPERFVRSIPRPPSPPVAAWINPPQDQLVAPQQIARSAESNVSSLGELLGSSDRAPTILELPGAVVSAVSN